MSERHEWLVLGRIIGTATDWEELDVSSITLYNFQPAEGINLPVCDNLQVDWEKGIIQYDNNAGNTVSCADIIDVLKNTPRHQELKPL